MTVSPDGAQLYVASSPFFGDPASVAVFERDVTTGRLRFVDAVAGSPDGVEALRGARFLALSPDGEHAYVASFEGVVAFARDRSDSRPISTACAASTASRPSSP